MVEVTLALGVAAVSLLIIAAMLPISIKTNQQVSKQFSLDPSKGIKGRWDPTPQYIYFDYDTRPTNTNPNQSTAPSDALYRVTLTYRLPPTDTTSLADIKVSWPAAQSDLTKVAGSVEMFVAINR